MGIRSLKIKGPAFGRMTAAQYHGTARESDIQRGIVEYLRLRGVPCCVTDAGLIVSEGEIAGRQVLTDGWPDVIAVLAGGRMLAIETKSRGGKLRPAQVKVLGGLVAAGAAVMVPRSVSEFIDCLNSLIAT
jgi:hypothetical protein